MSARPPVLVLLTCLLACASGCRFELCFDLLGPGSRDPAFSGDAPVEKGVVTASDPFAGDAPGVLPACFTVERNGVVFVLDRRTRSDAVETLLAGTVIEARGDVGRDGKTIIVIADGDTPEAVETLWEQFERERLYYAEEMHEDRLYVFGNADTHERFMETFELTGPRMVIGAGPGGETVFFETGTDDDDLPERIEAVFEERHTFYEEVETDGRIHVFGTPEARDAFIERGTIPASKSFIGAGPDGETVIIEAGARPSLVVRLVREFAERHGVDPEGPR